MFSKVASMPQLTKQSQENKKKFKQSSIDATVNETVTGK